VFLGFFCDEVVMVDSEVPVRVDFVEHHNGGLVVAFDVLKDIVHRFYMVFKIGV
jgi:hypothetical protein